MAMDFSFIPSLKHRTLVKIVVEFFNRTDIQELISKCRRIKYKKVYVHTAIELVKEQSKEVGKEIFKYVLKLPLPDLLINDLLSFVEVLGFQLLKWKGYSHHKGSYIKNLTKFHWTPEGTIDKNKSTELYTNDEIIPLQLRYIIAYEACLEDYCCTLWKQLNEGKHHETCRNLRRIRECEDSLSIFWSHNIEGKLDLMNGLVRGFCSDMDISPCYSLNEYMIHYSVVGANAMATKYFFEKLTSEEKVKIVLPLVIWSLSTHDNLADFRASFSASRVFDLDAFADISFFFISNLDEKQQKEIFKKHPSQVLKCFLIWPRQIFFMDLVKSMFCYPTQIYPTDFTPEVEHYRVLKMIASKILNGFPDYNYRKLFAEFWQESHCTYKKYVIDNYASDSILSNVFKVEDTKSFQLVLKDIFISRKRKMFCG